MEQAGERGCWGGVKAREWEEMGRPRVGNGAESHPNWGRRDGGGYSLLTPEGAGLHLLRTGQNKAGGPGSEGRGMWQSSGAAEGECVLPKEEGRVPNLGMLVK